MKASTLHKFADETQKAMHESLVRAFEQGGGNEWIIETENDGDWTVEAIEPSKTAGHLVLTVANADTEETRKIEISAYVVITETSSIADIKS